MKKEMRSDYKKLKYIELLDNYILVNDIYSIMLAKLRQVESGENKGKWYVINQTYHHDLKSVVKKILNDKTREAIDNANNLQEIINNLESFEERLFNVFPNITIKDLKEAKQGGNDNE